MNPQIAKRRKIRSLADEGFSDVEIAKQLGIHRSTAKKWRDYEPQFVLCLYCDSLIEISDERQRYCDGNCRRRYSDAQHVAECPDCGKQLMDGSGWPGKAPKRCAECHFKQQREQTEARGEQIVAWWRAGETIRQIRERLGWSKGHLGMEMRRLRKKGYDLPYRRSPEVRAKIQQRAIESWQRRHGGPLAK